MIDPVVLEELQRLLQHNLDRYGETYLAEGDLTELGALVGEHLPAILEALRKTEAMIHDLGLYQRRQSDMLAEIDYWRRQLRAAWKVG